MSTKIGETERRQRAKKRGGFNTTREKREAFMASIRDLPLSCTVGEAVEFAFRACGPRAAFGEMEALVRAEFSARPAVEAAS